MTILLMSMLVISLKKIQAVAEGLGKVQKSDGRSLKHALLDAKSWFSNKAGWAWDELSKILNSETAQRTIGTITESGIKGAIKGVSGSG